MRRLSPNAVMEQYWWLNPVQTDVKWFKKLKNNWNKRELLLGVILNKFNIKAAEYGSYGGDTDLTESTERNKE